MNYIKINRSITVSLTAFLLIIMTSCQPKEKHLFVLSGQSNMSRLNVEDTFLPAVVEAFGEDNVIVVKNDKGGESIRRWYRDWQAPAGSDVVAEPYLYDSLMNVLTPAITNQEIATVTFIWMQGERDARQKYGANYAQNLQGLYDQLSDDLGRNDMNFVVGRLSDFDLENKKYPHWTMVREAQMAVGASNPRFTWIDTDDCNDGINNKGKQIKNDLHMSEEGYSKMGKRFAEAAIRLIKEN
ncbi:sialate O-acetylesterase [Neolewinella persica]|uniref:sialate O-acetylesterase n=1 Tax=Neolewinella persica TaxID=70998 RepID=UPI00146B5F70|nr:sialate O-acetylesterase [Neolewinella persica]